MNANRAGGGGLSVDAGEQKDVIGVVAVAAARVGPQPAGDRRRQFVGGDVDV